jgi:hypothetical protein
MGYPTTPDVLMAGEPGSGQTLAVSQSGTSTIIDGTSAVTLGEGVANDAMLYGVIILANGAAVTATIGGMLKRNAAGVEVAASFILTGSTTADVVYSFPAGMRNSAGALTITASVDEKVIVLWDEA